MEYRGVIFSIALAALLVACAKDPEVAPVPAPPPWVSLANFKFPDNLTKSRIGRSVCFQIQARLGTSERRIAAAKMVCPAETETVLPDSAIVFNLTPSAERENILLFKDGVLVGLAGPSPAKTGLVPLDTREAGSLRLHHLCQFSEPGEPANPYYQRVCQLTFDSEGSLTGLVFNPIKDAFFEYTDDKEKLVDLSVRLEADRRSLSEQVKRLNDRIRLLESHAETDAFLQQAEQKMDALRTELKLSPDATPEQVGAAVGRQAVLISQFSREITDLKKALDLPKTATFEDVVKALQAFKVKRDGEAAVAPPVSERKEPAKSPIN